MRFSRLSLLPLALIAAAACHDDSVSVNTRPPLGGVRFVNAVPDGGPVDIRMVDQVEWSANSVSDNTACCGLPFRGGTIHWATEAKARHIRVFPTDSSLAVTTQILHDTTITIEANKNITLMLVGSRAAGGKVSFVTIDDNPGAVPATQIATRLVNAGSTAQPGSASGYITATASTPLPASATFPTVAPRSASAYVLRNTGAFAFQATPAGDNTTIWAASSAPTGAPADGLIGATAGATGGGSAFSAYLFPRSVAGTAAPQSAAFQVPALVYFVDLVPAPPK
ncbi:MAG TPA: DUF4397 domain-containing protein [Gemmatimonadaceae bacterium]|nr:DUF4397 domain-containing protein [Gemmatimonadaceae bacterium]